MSVQATAAGGISVSGALTFESVASVYSSARTLLSDFSGAIDLAQVSSVDSSGLALLLEWQAAAKKRGTRLRFLNAPSDLSRLAALSGAGELLGLKPRSDSHGD